MDIAIQDAVLATGGTLHGSCRSETRLTGISTDSRTLKPGEWFVALRGENFDGHEFVDVAVSRGAAGLIVEQLFERHECLPQILVVDALRALGDLARVWRRRNARTPLAAIVGSVGKTTTKEMAIRIVASERKLLATVGNLNNLVGVPRMIFNLSPRHQAAVLELGMNAPGELKRLTEIAAPDCVALLNIRNSHIGNFGTQEALYRAKCEALIHAPRTALFVMNVEDELSRRARAEVASGRAVMTFGLAAEADIRATSITSLEPFGTSFMLNLPGARPQKVELRCFGRANVHNALAAAAVGMFFGISPEAIALQLSLFRAAGGRSEVETLKGWHVVKDYYNASPASVEAALESLGDFEITGRRFAVLGDMLELGALEESLHRQVGVAAARAGLAGLFTVGERGRWIGEAAAEEGVAVEHAADAAAAAELLKQILRPGDLVLIKGSRLMRLEQVYEALKT